GSGSPLAQQIKNILSLISQADAAGRMDEVRTLQLNLCQLMVEYFQQSDGDGGSPLAQQIKNIHSFGHQAWAAGRLDEVLTIQENLYQLMKEYFQQSD
uniref:metallo-Diels-Alderase DA7 W16S n=1 Tax=synthetic construct TaxID=32630 RepID=UPI001B35819C|nr:Chain A, metallo-Diels-Alderase DA7 W16S [synthetic construct]7BWW_B Chain B, metallo-Diels-Alderase DA7 W16S [synthetic construct]7BWW_C Chain C, metallo-Diels-Alderase DA7 W16S [synthetic construct]7BWW_D Chain D, metallo-Diels-Alderase DA7 W16S [synthetic construct]